MNIYIFCFNCTIGGIDILLRFLYENEVDGAGLDNTGLDNTGLNEAGLDFLADALLPKRCFDIVSKKFIYTLYK